MDDNSNTLRERAKDELRQKKKIDPSLYETDLKVLVEELSIYQIELEHQNQELMWSQDHLQQSKNRYLDLFDNAPVGYLIVDSDGTVKDINQTACLLLESNKPEFLNNKITKIIHPEFQDIYYIYFRSLFRQKHNRTCDIKLRKSNKTFFYARIQGIRQSRLKSDDPEFRLAVIDISIQKELEFKLLIAKEKAEESERLKSAFLANMSHEIRTPMNGILGFADLLKNPDLTGEQQKECIGIIGESGARMLNIINNIVDISKIEAGMMKMDIKETNVNEQVEYIYNFFKPEVETKGMKLSVGDCMPEQEVILNTDREKVYAILTNLVKNSIKYSNAGTIEIGYKIIEKQGLASLLFYVKDTGIGIPKDRHEAIFERFIQANLNSKIAQQGAGLGLAISKAYVEMLGGKIWVESEEGIGSTFYFTLPYNSEAKTNNIILENSGAQAQNEIPKLKILIVEDDEISGKLILLNIEKISRKVLKAKTGIQAVEICRSNTDIDLVLMDIQIPEMDGHEATRQIRQFNKDVVIIAQTAYGLSGDREKAIEAGCNDYITKPINKTLLFELIKKNVICERQNH